VVPTGAKDAVAVPLPFPVLAPVLGGNLNMAPVLGENQYGQR
jgi:hypothetical protein